MAYDLLIKNGRVVDGSGAPAFNADVAVQGDKIAGVGKYAGATAKRTIDAEGPNRNQLMNKAPYPKPRLDGERPEMISVLVPIYNEEMNIPILVDQLLSVLDKCGKAFEIVLVNDGSRDGSLAELKKAAARRHELKVVSFRRNFGQTAAIMAAIDFSCGDILVPIDADLQNDPEDVPLLIAKLDEGFDVVSGWRRERRDAALRRNLLSRIANLLISRISGVHLHDYGCTLKVYRSEVLRGVRLYGEMHRFIPIYATWFGARVTEMPVRHRARIHGRSNYGLGRVFKVLLDIIVVKFLDRHFTKPIYVFGGFGIMSITLSALSGISAIYLKIFEGISFVSSPLPLMTVMTLATGVMSILMGLLAEMLVRTYFEAQNKAAYFVHETINFDA